MYKELLEKKAKLALVGLGYVGLPIALEFAKKISVIGFDINESRLAKMRQGIDPCGELGREAFGGCDINFTSSIDVLREASFFIVAVPIGVRRIVERYAQFMRRTHHFYTFFPRGRIAVGMRKPHAPHPDGADFDCTKHSFFHNSLHSAV